MSETMDLKPEDRVLLFASPAFDASMVEVFHALLNGAALVPAPAATIADADAFLALMRGCGVTVATLPPAYLAALGQPDLGRLRLLLTAGEPPISADLRYYAARLNYINAYGPTEASVCATIWVVPQADWKEAELPIGAPIGNTRLHILDADLEEVPIGVPGEICLSGAGLAECYLDDPEATARAFVEWRGTRLYRTGDRGIWRADGLASYSGRLDQQVKIRGQRVEPAEIEAALMAEPEVAQAVILARGEEADRHLVAWIAPRVGKAQPSVSALRARLAATLPRAMVPRHLVWVPALPRTVNGKIDRAALPEPQPGPEAPDDVPQGPQEATLAEAFARVLGRERVGRHDDFFEFGGDSIRLLQLTIERRPIRAPALRRLRPAYGASRQ
jgi:acyl-coenzyme A synthetase/AMP-(fatty) acid ligase